MINWIKKKYKAFLVLIGLTTAICLGAELLPVKPPIIEPIEVFKTEKEVYEKFVINKEIQESFSLIASTTQFKTKIKHRDDLKVKVGETDDFKPVAEISRWDGEVKMKVKPKLDSKTVKKELYLDKKKIKYKEDKKEFHFYEIKKGDETINGATSTMDAFEIEVVLLEKPNTNIVEMEIETQGLDFFYQPELTQKEKDEGAFRPIEVVGSYAVYHSEKQGDYTQLGKKNYMTGKAFHIYRPLIIDSASTTVWGVLNIDNGLLTVEIPQEFLDTAVYPVIVDPTFGYTTVGASYSDTNANNLFGSLYNSFIVANSISISIYQTSNPIDINLKGILVLHSNLGIVSNGVGNAIIAPADTSGWVTSTFATSPILSANTEYVLMAISDANAWKTTFDTGDANQGHWDGSNNYTTPTNPTDASHHTHRISIYATYACNTGASASDFTYHKSITLEADEIATTTTSFPVLATTTDADLKTTTHGGHINFDDARDLVFLDTDQTTLLDFEIESYATTTGALVAWVDVSISSTTDKVIYMYYGDSDATLNYECSPQVYDDNFVMVQHLQEAPAGTTYDSTSNNNDGTTYNMDSADQVTGQIDGSLDFDGGDDNVDVPTITQTGELTVSIWTKPTFDANYRMFISKEAIGSISKIGQVNNGANFFVRIVDGGSSDTTASLPSSDVWHNIIITRNSGNKVDLYIDGGSPSRLFSDAAQSGNAIWGMIGMGASDNTQNWDGIIDEVRISNVARSAGWIATEYNNQSDVDTFLTYGAEQGGEAEEDDPDYGELKIKSGTLYIKSGTMRIKN